MLYLPISRSWIVSSRAQQVYLACALSGLALLAVVVGTLIAVAAGGGDSFSVSPLVIRVLLWPCVAGTAALSIAMWYFWFSFDDSGWLKKSAWFVLLYLVIMIGPALYYFFVYRSSGTLDGTRSEA